MSHQDQYDEGMFEFSQERYDRAIELFSAILSDDPGHFDAQLSIGMAWYRKGEFARAIEEGHKAEKLKPHEQLVHTNLSLFYMKSGDKKTAEHHGLQARIASWREPVVKEGEKPAEPELQMAKPPPPKMPEMPWKKNKPLTPAAPPSKSTTDSETK